MCFKSLSVSIYLSNTHINLQTLHLCCPVCVGGEGDSMFCYQYRQCLQTLAFRALVARTACAALSTTTLSARASPATTALLPTVVQSASSAQTAPRTRLALLSRALTRAQARADSLHTARWSITTQSVPARLDLSEIHFCIVSKKKVSMLLRISPLAFKSLFIFCLCSLLLLPQVFYHTFDLCNNQLHVYTCLNIDIYYITQK